MANPVNTRRPCDDPSSGSQRIGEYLACELLLLTPYQLEIYWRAEVLSEPIRIGDRTLYNRAEIMKLKHTLDDYRYKPCAHAGHMVFAKVNFHLRKASDCSIPSTWWYQARVIANSTRTKLHG